MRNRAVTLGALLATIVVGQPAAAQILPPFRTIDENGVDLGKGTYLLNFQEGSIGSGEARLSLVRVALDNRPSQWDEIKLRQKANISEGTVTGTVELPGKTDVSFTKPLSSGGFSPDIPYGESLTNTGTAWRYQSADGSKIDFDCTSTPGPLSCANSALKPSRVIYPNGNVVTLTHDIFDTTSGLDPWRIASITNTFGYSIEFTYQANGSGPGSAPPTGWYNRTTATFKKSGSTQFTITYAYPSAGTIDITDPAGATWRVTGTSIKRPTEASPGFVVTGSPVVTSVTRDGVTTSYARTTSPATTMTKTNALGQSMVYTFNSGINQPTSIKDGLNRTTSYQYDSQGRLTRTTQPEGNYVELTLDSRGNAITTNAVAKAGSGLANIVTSATFDATCTNQLTCNKPNTTTDARGNVTDYNYDPTHGGVLTVTSPAPSVGAVRPQTRYSYTQIGGIYSPTGTSACATGSAPACVGTTDEAKASVAFDTSGNMTSSSASDGTATLIATSTMTYDAVGNLLTVDGPLVGSDDTTRYRYDTARRLVGVIGPNPDGGGPLKHRATRNTYRTDGQLSKIERGTVNTQSDPDWAAFAPVETVEIGYDSNNRPITRTLSGSTGAAALLQQSYDTAGRVDCVTTRMNPAVYGALPASACTLGTAGSFGADRINKSVYDAAGQVTQQQIAVGTGDAAIEAFTYTNNGKLQTLKDAENNLTTHEYDGFDRLAKTRMPNTTKGSGTSSTTDYEQLGYDAASNVTSRRLRDAQSIAFTYDNLNRPTLKDLPAGETDVSFVYDNLRRTTSATQGSYTLIFGYDALSRQTSDVQGWGSISRSFDLAGRVTRTTWWDGFYVDYDRLVTGEMTKARENGATSGAGVLATFAYDDLGRRISLTRGNTAVTSYTFDPVSRLATLAENFAGTTNDQSLTFSYSPAFQISGLTRTNTAFAWTGHGSGSTAGVANGLNQLTSVGGTATAHDARGNLTSDPTTGKTFSYWTENMLKTASGGVSIYYDPIGRMSEYDTTVSTRFMYDGAQAAVEIDNPAGNILKRYVWGDAPDELLVQYDGAGTANRTWLHADERGSIIATSDGSGNLVNINRYDEFGKPQATNAGRFQYTGQMWLSEVGAYYYKARIYSPTLGRFLQTDPIGGPNLYAYSGNDPVNLADPSGMRTQVTRPDALRYGESYFTLTPHSHDWMGGMGFHITGSLDAAILSDAFEAWDRIGQIAASYGSTAECFMSNGCTNAAVAVSNRLSILQGASVFDAGSLNGLQTFGSQPSMGDPNRFFPQGRIVSAGAGGFMGAFEDLDYLATLNGLPAPTPTGWMSLAPKGWLLSINRVNGTQILLNVSTRLTFRGNGSVGKYQIDIPAGMRIAPNNVYSVLPETVHYTGF